MGEEHKNNISLSSLATSSCPSQQELLLLLNPLLCFGICSHMRCVVSVGLTCLDSVCAVLYEENASVNRPGQKLSLVCPGLLTVSLSLTFRMVPPP